MNLCCSWRCDVICLEFRLLHVSHDPRRRAVCCTLSTGCTQRSLLARQVHDPSKHSVVNRFFSFKSRFQNIRNFQQLDREYGKHVQIESFDGHQVTLVRGDGLTFPVYLSPYPWKLQQFVSNGQWESAQRLCSSIKVITDVHRLSLSRLNSCICLQRWNSSGFA